LPPAGEPGPQRVRAARRRVRHGRDRRAAVIDRCFGKYLAQVVDNDDPKGLARVRVQVPEILGEETTGWCLPSSPWAGPGVGLAVVPPVDALVLVEWPAGDTGRTPI